MAGFKKEIVNFYDEINNLDEVSKIQAEEMKAGAQRALDKFKKQWPIDTGFSYKEWRVGSDDLNGDKTSVSIVNDAQYTKWVHRKGENTAVVNELDSYMKAEIAEIQKRIYQRTKKHFEGK